MKRRILMVSAMMLLLGSQVQMYAQKKVRPDFKRPGIEMRAGGKPGGPMFEKTVCQKDVESIRNYYKFKYGVKLSKKEAEKILLVQMREKGNFAMKKPYRR